MSRSRVVAGKRVKPVDFAEAIANETSNFIHPISQSRDVEISYKLDKSYLCEEKKKESVNFSAYFSQSYSRVKTIKLLVFLRRL